MTRARDLADIADKDISGTVTLDDIVLSNDMSVADNGKVQLGAGNDLQIYHDGSNSFIAGNNAGNNTVGIKPGGSGSVLITNSAGDNIITQQGDAAHLHYNAFTKLATTSTGVDVTGTVTADGLAVDGNATIVNNLGRLTLSDGDGTNQKVFLDSNGGSAGITAQNNTSHGTIFLKRYNGTDTLITLGVSSNGDITMFKDDGSTAGLTFDASSGDTTFAANINLGDGGKAIFGTTSDGLQIYNESSGDKRIVESGNGNLKIQGDNLYLQNSAGTENHIIALTDSSVSLMFNNESRLATVTGGVEVTGYIDPDYKRPNSPGAQTSNNNGHWWKLGTVSGFNGSQSLEITLYGTQSYSSSSNIAGKTTLLARANNAVSTIEATFWSETMGNDGIQSAAWINTANNQFDIYVQVGTFFGLESTVVTSATWTPNLSNTGSNSQPASSVVFERLYYFQLGIGDKRLVHGSSETVINESGLNKDFRVESDSSTHMLFVDGGSNVVGVKTSSPDSSFPMTVGGTGSSQLLLQSTGDTGYTQGSMVIKSGTTENPSNRGQGIYMFNEGNDRTWYAGTLYGNGTEYGIGTVSNADFQNSAADNSNATVRFKTGGDVQIVDGNLVVASGHGIDFSATSGAGTSELFDDYEEGTYTVNERNGQATLTTNRCHYVRIGRMVFVQASVTVGSTSNSNLLNFTLPFSSTINGFYLGGGSVSYHNLESAYYHLRPNIENAADNVFFYYGGGINTLTCAQASGHRIDFAVSYMAY